MQARRGSRWLLGALNVMMVVTVLAVALEAMARAVRPPSVDVGAIGALVCPDNDATVACKAIAGRDSDVACDSDHEGPAPTSFLTCDQYPVVSMTWPGADGGALRGRVEASGFYDSAACWTCIDGERTLYVWHPGEEEPEARKAFDRACAALRAR